MASSNRKAYSVVRVSPTNQTRGFNFLREKTLILTMYRALIGGLTHRTASVCQPLFRGTFFLSSFPDVEIR